MTADRSLRLALRLDAIYEIILGAIAIFASNQVAEWIGFPDQAGLVIAFGVLLWVAAGILAFLAAQPSVPRLPALIMTIINLVGAVASAVLLVAVPNLTDGARISLLVIGVGVAIWGVWELLALRRLRG